GMTRPPGSTLCPYTTLFRSLGYPDEATRQQAAFAMGESATRFLRLSEAAGMLRDAMVAYDQAMAAETAARAEAAERSASGSLTGDRKSTRLNSSHVKISYAV